MKRLVIGLFVLYGLAYGFEATGGRLNLTPSAPRGVYWETKNPAHRGDFVLFCPSAEPVFEEAVRRGYLPLGHCPSGSVPLLKRLVAVADDLVEIEPAGIHINGRLIPGTTQLRIDGQSRPMPSPHIARVLGVGEALLLAGQNPLSFDGRYFGPVSTSDLSGAVYPVLTF